MNSRWLRFEVHKAQKIAAAFLLLFLLQSLWLAGHLPFTMAETRNALVGKALWSRRALVNSRSPLIPGDSILTLRCAGFLPSIAQHWQNREFSLYAAPNRWLVRIPFVVFGIWLGGALWWVSRRIFGDEGGYITLGLYCFSPSLLIASATVDSAILASWGLFGLIFTAIGVAHTVYAAPSRWRARILLLGAAIGLTAAASLAAAIAGVIFATGFMLYLAPRRRRITLAILAVSGAIGALIFLICFGFNVKDVSAALNVSSDYLKFTTYRLITFTTIPGGWLEIVAFAAGLTVFALWRRTRYFGNTAPLILALVLPWWPGPYQAGSSFVWTIPFMLVFIGGIYADLLELNFFSGRFRKLVAATAFVLVGASAVMSLAVMTGA